MPSRRSHGEVLVSASMALGISEGCLEELAQDLAEVLIRLCGNLLHPTNT